MAPDSGKSSIRSTCSVSLARKRPGARVTFAVVGHDRIEIFFNAGMEGPVAIYHFQPMSTDYYQGPTPRRGYSDGSSLWRKPVGGWGPRTGSDRSGYGR